MPIPAWILASTLGIMLARADDFVLTVDPNTVAECGHVQFNWEGGVPPYEITAIPPQHYASDIMVPNDLKMDNGRGSYQWMLPYQQKNPYTNSPQQILFFMTDSRNVRTKATDLITLGDPAAGMDCTLVTAADPPWSMQVVPNGQTTQYFFKQCENMTFDWSAQPTNNTPVTITAAVPNSTVIQFSSEPNATSINWIANVEAGADIVFTAWDAQQKQGGTTKVVPIIENIDKSCLGPGTLNITRPALPPSSKLATGAVAGIAAGATVGALCALALATFFFLRHKRRKAKSDPDELPTRPDFFASPPPVHEPLYRSHPGSPISDHVMVYGPHGAPMWATPVHSIAPSGLPSVSSPSLHPTVPSVTPSQSRSYSHASGSVAGSVVPSQSRSYSHASGSVAGSSSARTTSPLTATTTPSPLTISPTSPASSTTPTTEPPLKWTLMHGPPPSIDNSPNPHNSDSTEVAFAQHPGGYRFHQDGGLLQAAPAPVPNPPPAPSLAPTPISATTPAPAPAPRVRTPEPLDMPPLYDASWRRTQSQNRSQSHAEPDPHARGQAL